ncbi:MAG: hypothetical protein U0S50_03245 [Sphingopyxis sp.]|uniref:EF-hand domain-containing protein n=1 Tax=Sphingopyxis sp. TaxID=1908224 RepID=UPI002AB94737|nr:hypothetical protein [Sphingopyxis sp.]MDZ3830819.1 hypothetical protein [Sphingopyxis sp.]
MYKNILLLTLLLPPPVLAAPGSERDHGDADGNGVVTRAEVQVHASRMFAKMDVNGDGKLDAADRAAKREAMHAKMFERLDANKDGNISKAEWDQHAADRSAKRGATRAMDRDMDGGKRHVMRGHHGKGNERRDMGSRMMTMADTDGDKAISPAEFQAAAIARFDRMDTNKDGQVTAEERAAARQSMRDKRMAPPRTN